MKKQPVSNCCHAALFVGGKGMTHYHVCNECKEPCDIYVETDPIVKKVRQKLLDRSQVGIKKYGTTLEENNTDDMLTHAQEEAMDLALYLQKLIEQRDEQKVQ